MKLYSFGIKPSKNIKEMTKRIFYYEQTEECVIDGILNRTWSI